jgi:hypothetical protein
MFVENALLFVILVPEFSKLLLQFALELALELALGRPLSL